MRINVEIKVCHVFPSNWKVYELQTWYTDEARSPVSPTSAMSSKVKGQGRKVTGVGLAHKTRTKSPQSQNIEIVKKVAHLTGNNAHQVRGQKVKG